MTFVLSAMALLQAQAAPAGDALANGRWQTMTTRQLAARLLPPKLANTVVAHKAQPLMGADGPLFAATFFGRPRASLDGFCERRWYPAHVNSESPLAQGIAVRLGACPAAGDAEFAHLNPETQAAEAKAALRWLADASEQAKGSGPLPFQVECVAQAEPERCAGGGRTALAKLPAVNVFLADGAFTCQPGEIRLAVRQVPLPPGIVASAIWSVRLVRAAKHQRPRVQMTWAMPAPF